MPRRISLQSHLSTDELERRYRGTKEPVERSHWHMLWLLAQGQTATQVAANTGYSAYWIGQIARRYNEQGVEGMADRRRTAPHQSPTLLSAELLAELRTVLSQPAPDGERWSGRTVAEWMAAQLGRAVRYQRGWEYLQRLKARQLVPRPRHIQADPDAQAAFKKN
jgi:transposase